MRCGRCWGEQCVWMSTLYADTRSDNATSEMQVIFEVTVFTIQDFEDAVLKIQQVYSSVFKLLQKSPAFYPLGALAFQAELPSQKWFEMPGTRINTAFLIVHKKNTVPGNLDCQKQCFQCAIRGSNPGHPD